MKQNGLSTGEKLALGLGIFSIGLGLMELLAPRRVEKMIGVKKKTKVLRTFGAREIASGVGILAQPSKPAWVWSRVAGDAMDLAFLASTMKERKTNKKKLAMAVAAVAGVSALDVYCGKQLKNNSNGHHAVKITRSLIIERSAEDLYDFWRHLERLPHIMSHLESVEQRDGNRSHWVAKAPAGMKAEWDAEITADIPNQVIAWKSLPGADVDNAGSVKFEPAPGNRGTLVTVTVEYTPPGGVLTAKASKLFGKSPEQEIEVDLREFKQLMETGEISRTEGQPAGRKDSLSKHDRFVHA